MVLPGNGNTNLNRYMKKSQAGTGKQDCFFILNTAATETSNRLNKTDLILSNKFASSQKYF